MASSWEIRRAVSVGLAITVDMLVPLYVGWSMFRVVGKWKIPGVALVSVSLTVVLRWTPYWTYAAVAGVTIGLL